MAVESKRVIIAVLTQFIKQSPFICLSLEEFSRDIVATDTICRRNPLYGLGRFDRQTNFP